MIQQIISNNQTNGLNSLIHITKKIIIILIFCEISEIFNVNVKKDIDEKKKETEITSFAFPE
jgi:hypothetical protein